MNNSPIDFPVNDADNHMYETTDPFTKFLPRSYDGLSSMSQVNGRRDCVKNVSPTTSRIPPSRSSRNPVPKRTTS